LLALVGAYYIGSYFLSTAKACWKYGVGMRKNLKARYGGGWVLVTGASDGLGKCYSEEFAKMGFNIVLVGRNLEKLNQVGKQLRQLNAAILTKTIVFDFSTLSTQESVEELERLLFKELADRDVSILVNNVGCTFFGKLETHSVRDCLR
jgi:17beta-estradiol 17-dehydrogenase / very-long-chain 3-oxoacyl-CoA reductase